MTSKNQYDNQTSEMETFEVCVVDDPEERLKPEKYRLELAGHRDEIFYPDELGRTMVRLAPFLHYLEARFKPVTYQGKLYIYDIPTGLYHLHRGEIGSAIEHVFDEQGYPGPIRHMKRELLERMADRKIACENPFDKVEGIPVQNCVLEIAKDGTLTREQYMPSHFIRCRAAAPFLFEQTGFSEGERFFREISCNDPEWVRDLFRILGYCLLPGNPAQKYFVFHGVGGNGKSVLMEWVLRTIDGLGARISARELFSGNVAQRETSLANNLHRRLLVASEAGPGAGTLNEDLLKRLTGDAAVSLNAIYRGEEVHTVNACLIFLANLPPAMQAGGKAMQRRQVCVPFDLDVPVAQQDPGRIDRLATPEGNQWLLARMVEGAQEYVREGCSGAFWDGFCARIRDDSRSVFAMQDSVSAFVENALVRDGTARTPGSEVFSRWYSWEYGDDQHLFEEKGGRGLHSRVPSKKFYAELRSAGVLMARRMRVNGRVMSNVLMGWRLRTDGVDGDI